MRTEITIIIPTYKPGDYLRECIASLAAQTLDPCFFKVLIVLNGTRDPYYSYISQVIAEYPKINFEISYSVERGVSLARNIGLSLSDSDFLSFIDDDDMVSEVYLEKLRNKAIRNAIVVSNVLTFSGRLENLEEDYISKAYKKLLKTRKKSNILSHRGFLSSVCGKLIAKDLIVNTRFNEKFSIGEDSLFMFSISPNIKQIVPADTSAVYFRRKRPDSASRRKRNNTTHFFQWVNSIGSYLSVYFKSPLKYGPIFFSTRLAAVTKVLIKNIFRAT